MFVTLLLFCVVGYIRAEDSDEVKYIDLLPEEEKRQFIQSIAKRIIEEVKSKNEDAGESKEISDDQLNENSEYVSKLLREETENSRRRNIEKFGEKLTTDAPSSEDDSLKVQRLEKYDSTNESNRMDNIDLTLDKGKAEKLISNEDKVTTEEDVSTPEITTENTPTVLTETTSNEAKEIQPKNISIEISIEDQSESSDNVNQKSKQATDLNEPTLQTIPVNIIYDSKIDANVAKNKNEENGNTSTSSELSITNERNNENNKEALRQNNADKVKSPAAVTVMEDFSPEAISDSDEEIKTKKPFKEATPTTTTVADEDWVFTAAILEPKAIQHENIQSSTEIEERETTQIVEENTEASIHADTAPSKDDPINSTQVAKPENETRDLRKIRDPVTANDLHITEETSTKNIKEDISESTTESTTISPFPTDLKSSTDNFETTDKYLQTTVNNEQVTDTTKTIVRETTPTIIEERNKTEKVLEEIENVSLVAENNSLNKSQTNEKDPENTVIIQESNGRPIKLLEALERSGLNKSELIEKQKHVALPDVKYETQIEDSKLFNKLKSKYDKEKEYYVYEIAPGEKALEKVQALEKERIANQIATNKQSSVRKPSDRKHFGPSEVKNKDKTPRYIPVHNYGPKNAYFNSHNRFDLKPDDSRAVDDTNRDITVDIMVDTRNEDTDSASKKLRASGKTVDTDEIPYVIPVHSYAPENAYFNAHNRFDLNFDDTADHGADLNVDISVNLSKEDLAPKKSYPELHAANLNRDIYEPRYIPVHNHASDHAYFNPHNRFDPSHDDFRADDSNDADVSFNLRERSGKKAPKKSDFHKHGNTRISKTNKLNSILHKTKDFQEHKFVPVYNYASKNAYYNPRNIYGPKYDVIRPEKDLKFGINDVINHNSGSDKSSEQVKFRSSDIEDYVDEITKDIPHNVQTGNNVRNFKHYKKQKGRPFEFRQKNTILRPIDNFDMDYFYGRKNNDEWSDSDVEHTTQKTRRDKLIMTDSDSPDHPFHSRHKKVLADPTSWARHVLFNHNRLGFHTRPTTKAEESYEDVVITTPAATTTNKRRHHYILKARDDAPETLNVKHDEKDKTFVQLRNDAAKKLLMKRFNGFPEPKPLTPMPEVEHKRPIVLRAKTTTEATTTQNIFDSEQIKIILDISEPHHAIAMIDKILEYHKTNQKPTPEPQEKKKTRLLRERKKYHKIWKVLRKLPSTLFRAVISKLYGRPKLTPILPNVIPYKSHKTKAVSNKPKPFVDPRVLEYLPTIENMIQQKQVKKPQYKDPKENNNIFIGVIVNRNKMLHQKRLEKDSKYLNAYIDVIRDMIRNDDKALKQYDWLGTTVDVRSAIDKLSTLIDGLANGEPIHPSDMQLLKYLLYLHDFSKNAIHNTRKQKTAAGLKPSHQQWNLKDELMKTKDIGNRVWLIKSINKADHEFEEQLAKFEDFLNDLQNGLMDLHDAIKHIAVITTFKHQRWYENLKDLYLNGAPKSKLIAVVIHLVTTRLFGLIQNSIVNGLDDDYVSYMEKNAQETSRTKQEFILVMKLLNELKKG